jgi:phenylpropionate dioxygenase-like ring-hydroxylating dioxygenase large terminal subunit
MLLRNFMPRNVWYVAAWSSQLTAGAPLPRRVCGQPVVLYRTADGTPVAVEDRCIHRGMPLSVGGEIDGDLIRCPYHGLEFDAAGRCVHMPGQQHVPKTAYIRSYRVVERDAMIWIWIGDQALADPEGVPVHTHHVDVGWQWTSIYLEIACNWEMLNDNLLDLTHLGYVHKRTIGGDPNAHAGAEMKTTQTGNGVFVRRWMPNSEPPPHYKAGHAFAGKIDRWQEIDFVPGLLRLYTGGMDANAGAYDGHRTGGVQFMGLHAVTPSSATRCYYFFSQARNFRLNEPELEAKLHDNALATLLEDKTVLEAQQARLLEEPDRGYIDMRTDAGGIQARRIIARLHAAELSARSGPSPSDPFETRR